MATGTTSKVTNAEVWDIDQRSGEGLPEHWRAHPAGLSQAVSVLLPEPLVVQAMHDLGEDLGKAKAVNTIKGLLDEIMGPLLEAHAGLSTALETIRHVLTSEGENRSEHLQQFDTDATEARAHFFPGLALDLGLQVVDFKEFFKAGDLHVTDKATSDRRRFDQMGTGVRILAKVTAHSGDCDRLAQPSLTGRCSLLGAVTIRQVGGRRLAHRVSAQGEPVSAV